MARRQQPIKAELLLGEEVPAVHSVATRGVGARQHDGMFSLVTHR